MNVRPEKNLEKDPEVREKPTRRRFTLEYKRKIALEAEQCTQPGQLGMLLRREGIYSSMLNRWRRQLRQENMPNPPKRRGPAAGAKKMQALVRENERLKEKLRQAELIIDVQKKSRR